MPGVWALSGRIETDNWVSRWWRDGASAAELRGARVRRPALAEAIEPYRKAFVIDPAHHCSGVKALMLLSLRRHLGGDGEPALLDDLVGGVRWAALSAQERNPQDCRARASHAALCLLVEPLETVCRAYGATAAAANGDWFALAFSRQTLCLLRDLEFRPRETAAALGIIDREIARSTPPLQPRRVFLFSGHMIDAPDRASPRFPPDKEGIAARRIAAALDALGAGPGDLALAQGASGGDLLFLEACKVRGVRLLLMLPFAEPAFIKRSVRPATDGRAGARVIAPCVPGCRMRRARCRLNWARCPGSAPRRGWIPTSAATAGCCTRPWRWGSTACISSACGAATVATAPAVRRTCTRRSGAGRAASPGSTPERCEDAH